MQIIVMNISISSSLRSAPEKKRHWPAVSIIMPFEPVIRRKEDLMMRLQKAVKKAEWEMGTGYDEDLAELVLMRLRTVIKNLNFSTFKKSIAIYVSPVFEKVIYLNMPVNETITVDDSFMIRDILHAKKEMPHYFVLLLGETRSGVYEGGSSGLVKIKFNSAAGMSSFKTEAVQADVGSGSNDLLFKNFLQHTDEGLGILLQSMPVPVIALGNKEVSAHFKEVTKHNHSIVEYIAGNNEEATESGLFDVVKPYIAEWNKIKTRYLYHQLESAAAGGKLESGIQAVQQSAARHRPRLLIVEKKIMSNPLECEMEGIEQPIENRFAKFSCIKHVIDDIIEKVLENGGDVEMVDDDMLGGQQIALVKG